MRFMQMPIKIANVHRICALDEVSELMMDFSMHEKCITIRNTRVKSKLYRYKVRWIIHIFKRVRYDFN